MQRSKYYILFTLALMLLLTGCKVRRPGYVIPEDQMEELLYDYHIAKAMGENLPHGESYKRALYLEYVFKKHKTTEQSFDTSMVWYTRHADVLSKMYGRINKKLKEEQEVINQLVAIRDNKPKTSAPGDSIDVWLMDRMVRLTGMPLNNRLTFEIPFDTNFKARDTLQWSVCYRFLDTYPDTVQAAIMAMAVQYENDTVIGQTKMVYESGMERIRIQSDTLGDIKKIQGFIYYNTSRRDTLIRLFADSISLMRYHSNDSLFAAKADSLEIKEETPKAEPKKKEAEQKTTPQQQERISPEEMRMRRERQRSVQRTTEDQEIKEEEIIER